jgi:hypothetical protein
MRAWCLHGLVIAVLALLTGAQAGLPYLRSAPALADGAVNRSAGTPEAAVRELVEARGDAYAGDCEATVSPRDIGRVCSKFVAERGELRAYLVGRTFSEYSHWVFVRRDRDGWRPVGSAPLDFFAIPVVIPWPG